jgi:hypothetical protein
LRTRREEIWKRSCSQAPTRVESTAAVDVEAGPDHVPPPAELELLPEREVAHRELPDEIQVGLLEADIVVRRVRASLLRAELGVGGEIVAVQVEGRDRAGRQPRGQRGFEREGGEVVPGPGDEGALVTVSFVLEEGVGRLAAHEPEEGEPASRSGLPVHPGLDVAEGGQLGPDDPVGDQVVVGASPRHEPGPSGAAGKPALHDDVGVGDAHRGRAPQSLVRGARAILDHQE